MLAMLAMLACATLLAAPFQLTVEQITHGPNHHFYGYIGHVGNTPWNGNDEYMVLLRTTFQDRMPEPAEPADIVLLDTNDDYAVKKVDRSRAWNFQQGAMLFWNPNAPDTQFFFNDRDPDTQHEFTVLYDIEKRERIREYRFENRPVANSGVAHGGSAFIALNYGRLGKLRPVTGYPGAYDWTDPEQNPDDDGIWKIDIESGDATLLLSFEKLAGLLRPTHPQVDEMGLFINHTLWSKEDDLILCYARAGWNEQGTRETRINVPFLLRPDGTVAKFPAKFLGGHPEWAPGGKIVGELGENQVLYDPLAESVTGTIGSPESIPDPGYDIALSHDNALFVNGYRDPFQNRYVIVDLQTGDHVTSDLFPIKHYLSGELRIDPAPAWRRDNRALAVPAIADDGTRQTFLIHLNEPETPHNVE